MTGYGIRCTILKPIYTGQMLGRRASILYLSLPFQWVYFEFVSFKITALFMINGI